MKVIPRVPTHLRSSPKTIVERRRQIRQKKKRKQSHVLHESKITLSHHVISMESAEERRLFRTTLLCLLKSIQGERTTIDLRNETSIDGVIEHVDGSMNVSLRDARVRRLGDEPSPSSSTPSHATFTVHGRQIRYVHIPSHVDMLKVMRRQVTFDDRKPRVQRRTKRRRTETN